MSLLLEPQEDMQLKYFGFTKSSKINLLKSKWGWEWFVCPPLPYFAYTLCNAALTGGSAVLYKDSQQAWWEDLNSSDLVGSPHSVGRGLSNSKPVPRTLVAPVLELWPDGAEAIQTEWSAVKSLGCCPFDSRAHFWPHGVTFVRRHKKVGVSVVLGCWQHLEVTTIQVTKNTCEGFFFS